ncbi:MAG: class II aldolase/adducin family protein [Lachnospiraceae bacterium]|nr:class II aldolase/adducin family protein [Lachnospiraceae bacterium]
MYKEIKEEIIDVARQAQREGLCKHKSGNFSVLDRENGLLIVSPSGIDREALTTDDMVVMSMEGEVIENISGTKPSSESLMHIAIYKVRSDVRAIVHTHSKYASVFAVLKKPIPPFLYESMYLGCEGHTVPVAPYGRPGTDELAKNAAAAMRTGNACLLEAHGAVAADPKGIREAYLTACYLEELCEIYHHVLSCNGGKEPDLLPAEELSKWSYPSEIKIG